MATRTLDQNGYYHGHVKPKVAEALNCGLEEAHSWVKGYLDIESTKDIQEEDFDENMARIALHFKGKVEILPRNADYKNQPPNTAFHGGE